MDFPTAFPAAFNQVLLSLVCILGIVYFALNLWRDHLRERPVPADTYAKEVDCRARHTELTSQVGHLREHFATSKEAEDRRGDQKRKEIYDMIRASASELRTEMKERFDGVESRLNDITRALGRLEGRHD